LIRSAGDTYVANAEAYISGALDRSLDELLPESESMKELQGFSRRHIYRSERVLELQAAGFELLPKLMDMFMEACLDRWEHGEGCSARNRNLTALLPVDCHPEQNVYALARQVIDFLASFSDRQAMRWYRRLQGIEL
jgi:dGTPase